MEQLEFDMQLLEDGAGKLADLRKQLTIKAAMPTSMRKALKSNESTLK